MSEYARTLSTFADRLFRTDGVDPGDAALPIAPERLAVYRGLVQQNYRSMIRFAFTATTRLMDHEAGRHAPEGGVRTVVEHFLTTSPAKTHSTREIARRFHEFLPEAYPEFLAGRPDVADLMRVEEAELLANYALDDPGRGVAPPELAELASGDVGAFLETRVLRAPSAAVLAVSYPVVHLRHEVMHRRFPEPPEARATHVSVSRGPVELLPVVAEITPEAAEILALAKPAEELTLEALAVRWIESSERLTDIDDATRLRLFATATVGALQNGVLRLTS